MKKESEADISMFIRSSAICHGDYYGSTSLAALWWRRVPIVMYYMRETAVPRKRQRDFTSE